jgi:hypothetical protein
MKLTPNTQKESTSIDASITSTKKYISTDYTQQKY